MKRTIPRWIRAGVFLLTLSFAVGSLVHAAMVYGSPGWGKAVFMANMAAIVFLPVLASEIRAYRCRKKEESTVLLGRDLLTKIRVFRRRKKER